MVKRGRKSSASIAVISKDGISTVARPKPPIELNDEMKTVWAVVVNSLPADWFPPEAQSLLVQYCRHQIAARRVAELIESYLSPSEDVEDGSGFDVEVYDRLLKMQEREGRAISSLSTRMRLSQQAKYTTQAAGTKSKNRSTIKEPWSK